ncbi:MAG: DUF6017 domain-containing protein [Intestinibacillus sp.]
MAETPAFDYYYGSESEQFSFFRIPRQLVTGEHFRRVSTDSKLLYGLLLDRMGLSAKNGWYDEQGRVFIYYTLGEIQADLCCGHEKAVKLLAELDTGKGVGLIERIKQGQGRPAKIYVKRFTIRAAPSSPPLAPEPHPRLPIFGSQDFGKAEVKGSEKPKSALPAFGSADFGKPDASYININNTYKNQLNPSIHPSCPRPRLMDRQTIKESVYENIDYEILREKTPADELDELIELIVDTLCTTRSTVKIGGEEIPSDEVRTRLWSLDASHIEYVFERLNANTEKVHNIRAYLLTALYRAPTTINHYYRAEVQHDLYGKP